MGIDIKVESTIDSEWNKSLGTNTYCKRAWLEADIEWRTIFGFIYFDPTLLYGNTPNFWTWEQLAVVLENLHKLSENPQYYAHEYSGLTVNDINTYKPSINKLIDFFTEYVNKKCRIIIY